MLEHMRIDKKVLGGPAAPGAAASGSASAFVTADYPARGAHAHARGALPGVPP